jgi:hypothetical protein
MFAGSNPSRAAARLAEHAVEELEVKFGGREGFIPLPEVHELKRFSNIPENPYLRKYLARKLARRREMTRCGAY